MSANNVQRGFPFLPLLGLLFIAFKLMGVVAWSWWWVLLPLYGPVLVGVVFLGFAIAAAVRGGSN